MNRTDIEYLDLTWNPVVGCTNGCSYCWARRQAKRQKHNCPKCYAFTPHLHPERLDEPLRRREPSVIGVAFMGDLFDPTLCDTNIGAVLDVMHRSARHTFVVLTKQPHRTAPFWLPPNLVLGVSVEGQESADRLIPELMECPAATRIVSIEPMRGPVDLCRVDENDVVSAKSDAFWEAAPWLRPSHLDGVILGGQTGPGAVPMDPDWVRRVRDDCAAAGVPFFFKAWGKHIPEDHRVALVPWMVGSKGRTLDGRTHDEVPWTKGGKA